MFCWEPLSPGIHAEVMLHPHKHQVHHPMATAHSFPKQGDAPAKLPKLLSNSLRNTTRRPKHWPSLQTPYFPMWRTGKGQYMEVPLLKPQNPTDPLPVYLSKAPEETPRGPMSMPRCVRDALGAQQEPTRYYACGPNVVVDRCMFADFTVSLPRRPPTLANFT